VNKFVEKPTVNASHYQVAYA
jgi:hypothetical protein